MKRKLKYSTDDMIKKSIECHGNKYDYANFCYTGIANKSTIICRVHGSFSQRVADHISGSGCQSCAGTSSNQKRIKSETEEQKSNRYRRIHDTRRRKDNYKSSAAKGYITASTTYLENGKSIAENRVDNMRRTRIERGTYINPLNKTDFQKYKSLVYYYTRKNRKLMNEKYPVKGMHLDHKLSIFDGFNSKIHPSKVGHIRNLEYITEIANRRKNRKSSLTVENLLLDIKKYEEYQTLLLEYITVCLLLHPILHL